MSFVVEIDSNNNNNKELVKEKKSLGSASRSKIYNSDSENLSLSDLDMIANKRKLAKKNTLSDSGEGSIKNKSEKSSIKPVPANSSRSRSRSRFKCNPNENENPQIRREKSEYLYKYNKLNAGNKYSSCKFDMNSPLSEIRNEYDRIKNGLENERSVKFLQRMMLLMIQGVEMMNTRFDPLGVDLDGWGESMAYSLETQEYDEVLSELYEKYKGVGNMSPEMKLLFMIISSASMFAITKKLTKNELNIGNLLGNLMGKGDKQQQKQQQQQQQQQFNYDDNSTTNDDPMPSKLNGPEDDISINDILSKMNKGKQEPKLPKIEESVDLNLDIDVDERTEDVLKNIVVPQTKRRGRPPRQRVSLQM
jgi:hypothetical protein